MTQAAIGRKNRLFLGKVEAGNRAARLLLIISASVRNDLDLWAYFNEVLDQLLARSTDNHALRADVWKQSHLRIRAHLSRGRTSRRRGPPPLPSRAASPRGPLLG
jgi:transposase